MNYSLKPNYKKNNKKDKPKCGVCGQNTTKLKAEWPQFILQRWNNGWPATTGEFPGKTPPKKPEHARGLLSSSLTPLAEEVQRLPAGECCQRILGAPEYELVGCQNCPLFFENGQKPNIMLQILGKKTEDEFFCRKKAQNLKKSAAEETFWILKDLGMSGRQSHNSPENPPGGRPFLFNLLHLNHWQNLTLPNSGSLILRPKKYT